MAVLYYTAPTGDVIIHSDTVVPTNQADLEVYSVHPGNLSINGTQFFSTHTVNISRTFGNQTIITPTVMPVDPSYFNDSMQVGTRAFQVLDLTIPRTNGTYQVHMVIDNTTLSFLHKTSPNIFPQVLTGLGQLGIALGYLFMGVVVFFIGSGTAAILLKRMKYWPKFEKMGWAFILLILVISMGALILSSYYPLAYIRWYYWLLPFYFFATLTMLEIWPQNWRKLFLLVIGNDDPDKDQDWDALFPRVADNPEDGTIEYLRPGRIHAIRRIFAHIPVEFSTGKARPQGIDLKPNPEGISSLYICKDTPHLGREQPRQRKHLKWAARPGITSYRIALSANAQKDIGDFISELRGVSDFADENDKLRTENRDFRIRLENGKIRYNGQEINEISRKIFGANMEFHKGKPEAQEEAKTKEKEESDGKKEK